MFQASSYNTYFSNYIEIFKIALYEKSLDFVLVPNHAEITSIVFKSKYNQPMLHKIIYSVLNFQILAVKKKKNV